MSEIAVAAANPAVVDDEVAIAEDSPCVICAGPADTTLALALAYDNGGRDRVMARACEPHATALQTVLRRDLDANAKKLALPFLFGPAVVGTSITVDR